MEACKIELAPEIAALRGTAEDLAAANPAVAGKIQSGVPSWLWLTGLLCAGLLFRLTIRLHR